MDEEQRAFMQWACKRHNWLWRHAFSRSTWRPLRLVCRRAAVVAMRADAFYWRHLKAS
jgi:hypothetical protein